MSFYFTLFLLGGSVPSGFNVYLSDICSVGFLVFLCVPSLGFCSDPSVAFSSASPELSSGRCSGQPHLPCLTLQFQRGAEL